MYDRYGEMWLPPRVLESKPQALRIAGANTFSSEASDRRLALQGPATDAWKLRTTGGEDRPSRNKRPSPERYALAGRNKWRTWRIRYSSTADGLTC